MDNINRLKTLINLLQEKKSFLSEMLEVTKTESKAIAEADIDTLNMLLNDKNVIIQDIDKSDEAFNYEYNTLKEELNVSSLDLSEELPVELLAELKIETKAIFELMKEVSDMHEDNKQIAKEIKDNLAAEIRRINTSVNANNIYKGNSAYQGSYYIDSKK